MCYAKDMLWALQNLHVQDGDTEICVSAYSNFSKRCSLWFIGNDPKKQDEVN